MMIIEAMMTTGVIIIAGGDVAIGIDGTAGTGTTKY
jgi:hypothetical protein